MSNSNNCIKCIEFTQLLADISHKGYLLLSAMAKCNKGIKIKRSILSFIQENTESVKDPCEWLYNLVKPIMEENVELIDTELIDDYDTFSAFMYTLDSENALLMEYELFYDLQQFSIGIETVESEEYVSLYDFEEDFIDNYLRQSPYRITTVSSKFFNISKDLLESIYQDIPFLIYENYDFKKNNVRATFINNDSTIAFHPTSKFDSSITILTEHCDYDSLSRSFKYEYNPSYINQLIETYYKLYL